VLVHCRHAAQALCLPVLSVTVLVINLLIFFLFLFSSSDYVISFLRDTRSIATRECRCIAGALRKHCAHLF
jgi:hypothetical protein